MTTALATATPQSIVSRLFTDAQLLRIVDIIAYRLRQKYPAVDLEEAKGFANLGVATAIATFQMNRLTNDSTQNEKIFAKWLWMKGSFFATDQLRSARYATRRGRTDPRSSEVSLYAGNSNGIVADHVDSEDSSLYRLELHDEVRAVLQSISKRERELLVDLFFNGIKLHELAHEQGISRAVMSYRKLSALNAARTARQVRS